MSGSSKDAPVAKRDIAYWLSLVAYILLGVPLVFTVAAQVILGPLRVVKLLDPPEWVDTYFITPLFYVGFALSVWVVWWVWKRLARQLASRAA